MEFPGQICATNLLSGNWTQRNCWPPLPIATTLGIGGLRVNLLTGLSLSLNGNAITLSNMIWDQLNIPANARVPDPLLVARALAARGANAAPLNFATVHAFSMHTFLLRLWLQAAGIDPDRDIKLIVLPPEQMCDSLARRMIDGFCAGEPWSSVAVAQGIGTVAASGYPILNNAPEKGLGVTELWHNHHPGTHLRLRLAVMEACRLLSEPEQRIRIAEIMSVPGYLNLPMKVLLPSLVGEYCFSKGAAPASVPDFHVFWTHQAGFPWRSHAEWIARQIYSLLGKPIDQDQIRAVVQQTWRPDLYREAARYLGEISPDHDEAQGQPRPELGTGAGSVAGS